MKNVGVATIEESEESKKPNEDDPTETAMESVPRKPGSKAQGRKRTKTGCLTCRKRRIKCGEEKPTCINCVKSKRQCEGYNQRVVFKDPLSLYRPSFVSASQSPHTQIARRHEDFHSIQISSINQSVTPKPPWSPELHTQELPASASILLHDIKDDQSIISHESSLEPSTIDHCVFPEVPKEYSQLDKGRNEIGVIVKEEFIRKSTLSLEATSFTWENHGIMNLHHQLGAHTANQDAVPMTGDNPTSRFSHIGRQGMTSIEISNSEPNAYSQTSCTQISGTGSTAHSINQLVVDKHLMDWNEDFDDPFDISEDEATVSDNQFNERLAQDEHLGIVVAIQASQDNQSLSIRSFTSFIDRPTMLAEYVPAPHSTPLQDPMAARIFCHFVNVTGPSISMFERHPANPTLIFRGAPVPRSQQHIWTSLALHNPALLHAMMALSSLHISKLQNGPVTPSLKHYAIGLRRVAKTVSSETRRRQPATLAAAMLLAFYECWSADHQKWSNHLLGAKQLVCEIDFAGMTRKIIEKQAQQRQERQLEYQLEGATTEDQIDEDIISILMGKKVLYDQFSQVMNDDASKPEWNKEFTARELETYETQRDLFWWYCKQDVYQSILGGGHLFLSYDLWSHCPPRAPLGRLNATYGSFDHLVLLMGRLAAFAAKDLRRKRSMIRANGGHWQHPQIAVKHSSGSQIAQPTQKPPFIGMVPVQDAKLPLGFEQTRRNGQLPQTQGEEANVETQTREAVTEWQEIRNAFNILEAHFGPEFQPLGHEDSQPLQTPFGPALQFRTYGIAGIWMNFYMALIFCHRSHPAMPPAAMVAAGHSARQTALFANRLGQIAAGISPDCNNATEVNPGVGAALIESATCLFVAGVQYQDATQRFWTVDRLRNIARLTGWQTALAIALGCEKTWTKAGELGRSPPYTRTNEEQKLPDIESSSRRIDRAFSSKSSKERRMVIEKPDRVHYALGVLGLEGDFENLDLDATGHSS